MLAEALLRLLMRQGPPGRLVVFEDMQRRELAAHAIRYTSLSSL
jgi:hypothetical protein